MRRRMVISAKAKVESDNQIKVKEAKNANKIIVERVAIDGMSSCVKHIWVKDHHHKNQLLSRLMETKD